MKKGVNKVLDKINKAVEKKYIPYINEINAYLQHYSFVNSLNFKPIVTDDNEYYFASIEFDGFTANFCFDPACCAGYRFMEGTLDEISNATRGLNYYALLTRIKFGFSSKYFSLYDIQNVLNSTDFRTLDFHRITSTEEFTENLKFVIDFIERNKSLIGNINDNYALQKQLEENYLADVVALDKNADLDEFQTDVESATMLYELDLFTQNRLEFGIDSFIRTGNNKSLWRAYDKYSKKNKLLTFEKRYVEYLINNDFPEPDKKIVEQRKNFSKSSIALAIAVIATFLVSIVLSIGFYVIISDIIASVFYGEQTYITVISDGISGLLIMASMIALIGISILKFKPDLLLNIGYGKYKDSKIIKLGPIVAGIVLVLSLVCYTVAEKNNMITADANGIYYGGEKAELNHTLEFIHIQGTQYDLEDASTFEETNDYYVICDGDYEIYTYCGGLYDENLNVKFEALNYIKGSGYPIKTYRTIEDYANAHNIELE